ncbi:MAG: VanZ family protein [Eubacterium sp.]|nr:VanZ family protein [Eubacterium sp.]
MNEKQRKYEKIVFRILFAIYVLLVIYFLFFAETTGRTISDRTYHYNLILFKEIKRFIVYREQLGMFAVTANLLGNVLIFLPFGMLVPFLTKRFKTFWSVALLTFEMSVLVELVQLVTKVGSCDVDDILLNTIGGMLGFVCYAIAVRCRRKVHYGK